jgi:hypothetical protein
MTPLSAATSTLFGAQGELWDRAGRLPDFSYAGYHHGDEPPPRPAVKANVKDFGAKGDGATDDTAAFRRAIEETHGGALLIPAGKYVLTDIFEITKPNLVLRGEGPDKTILYFPKGMEQIRPSRSATTSGQSTTAYSWSGGFFWIKGSQKGAEVGRLAARAPRGTRVIELDQTPAVKPGDRIEITQEELGQGSLLQHLYQGQSDSTAAIQKTRTRFASRVESVDGRRVTLQRPLRTDLDPSWNATVRIFAPSVTEVGIEDLGLEFPNAPYRGHFQEDGFNAVAMNGAADCWVRNIRIINADSGVFLNSSCFVTLDGLIFESERQTDKNGDTGHHGIIIGDDNLVTNFDFRCRFIHDIGAGGTGGGVVTRGRGVDLSFDHHRRYPHANLFTDIDLGEGRRVYKSGGGRDLGKHAAAWTTFWNLRSRQPVTKAPDGFGPDLITIVGVNSRDAAVLELEGRWFEPVDPASLEPSNLYEAQLALRKKSGAAGPKK